MLQPSRQKPYLDSKRYAFVIANGRPAQSAANEAGGDMRRNLALAGTERADDHARPLTCLACVVLMSGAFWTGALWIGHFLMHLRQSGV
jgi:hypothetical protein